MVRLILILTFGTPFLLSAQLQNNIWYFGSNGNGLDFSNPCEPLILNDGAIEGFEGVATIADPATGELLFYTNSGDVWNRNHELMENGNLLSAISDPFLWPFNSNSQVVIVPMPANEDLYYIFTTDNQAQEFLAVSLAYHIIDISQNNGLGAVVEKNIQLGEDLITEQIIAIPHDNGQDYWIITHLFNSNSFSTYLLDENGINTTPIYANVGNSIDSYILSNFNAIGQLAASPDGAHIALCTFVAPNVQLFDFNTATGEISNPIELAVEGNIIEEVEQSRLYGLCFSPDNSKLYASFGPIATWNAQLIQFDVSSGDETLINESKTILFDLQNFGGNEGLADMEIGPDGKIYVAKDLDDNSLAIINQPNESGLLANFEMEGLSLGNMGSTGWTLNNIVTHSFPALGSIPIAAPGNIVFLDKDGNNYFSNGDSLLQGIKVELYQGLDLIASTISNENGQYEFTHICPGIYHLVFKDENEMLLDFVDQNMGPEEQDSDVDQMGQVEIELTLGINDLLSIGAGFKALPTKLIPISMLQDIKVVDKKYNLEIEVRKEPLTFFLYQTNGQWIQKRILKKGIHQIDKRNLRQGIYFYQLMDQGGASYGGKIVGLNK